MAAAIHHKVREKRCQDGGTGILMLAVGGVLHEHGSRHQRHADELAGKMADIMKQRCRNHLFTVPVSLREMRGLQHVLADGDRLAEIFVSATPVENIVQKRDDRGLGQFAHRAACL